MIFHCDISYQKDRLLENTILPAQNINSVGKYSNLQLASSSFTTALLSSIWVLWKLDWFSVSLTIWGTELRGEKGQFLSNSLLHIKFFTHSKFSASVIYFSKACREGVSVWILNKRKTLKTGSCLQEKAKPKK